MNKPSEIAIKAANEFYSRAPSYRTKEYLAYQIDKAIEAQHQKTWALAMEIAANVAETHAVCQNKGYIKVYDVPPTGSNFEMQGKAIRSISCPPIEETKGE